MDLAEWIAAALGLINVALVVRRSVWNYPFAILMVSLYFFVFWDARLYSDALLQIFFLVINLYGWRNWLRSRAAAGEVVVKTMRARARIFWAVGTIAAALAWGLAMRSLTDAAAPMIDAGIAAGSISAQILLARRFIENWILWILVDIVAIGLFYSRGLEPTSALYAVFLLLSAIGLASWSKALRRRQAPA